ncbi:SH3 domain-containing protein [Geobacillus thermoleovorans]|uniref:SH3 domain-containing protein n=1 Tax=Geobacillus jurassicus TaxID=235932 RepID=A0ABV6GS69_9BACL|nr:SH3 domain-containing protein [Geobacillus jurassicus]
MKKMKKAIVLSTGLLLASTSFSVIPWNTPVVEAASSLKIPRTVYQTTANLNIRAGAGTKYKTVITVPKGKTVIATEKLGDWYKVSYTYSIKGKGHTKIGWVSGRYLKKVSSNPSAGATARPTAIPKTTYQTIANVNIRTGAGTKYKTIMTVPKGKTVTATEKLGNWYKVSYQYDWKGKRYVKTGWISGSYLREYDQYKNTSAAYYFTKTTTSLYGVPKRQGSTVKVASGNGLYSTRMVINSIGQIWYEVLFKGRKLYVLADDVTKIMPQRFSETKYEAIKDVGLYAAPGSAHDRLATIPKGTVITSALRIGDWYEVVYKEKKGYIYMSGVTKYVPAPSNSPSNPAPEQPSPPPSTSVTEQEMLGRTFAVRVNLNVRKLPDTNADILTIIPKGTIIVPTHKTSNNWYKLQYKGRIGYVSGASDYVTEVKTGAPLDGSRNGYQFLDLRTEAPIKAEQINAYIAKNAGNRPSVLIGKGQAFIDAGKKYGVNALYLAAHAIHESAFGTSRLALTKYNLFGYGAYDDAPFVAAYRFPSIEACIDYIARTIKATYLNPNYPLFKGAYLGFRTNTLAGVRVDESSEGMNFYYASDPYWGQIIARHMANMLAYDPDDYASARINETVPSRPPIPQGGDIFPSGIVAVANSEFSLYGEKGGEVVAKISKGSTFMLLEKTNDYWIRLQYNGRQYWTNAIKLYDYAHYMTVQNLGSVAADGLNVRSTPQIRNDNIIGQLKLGQYVQLKLTSNGTVEQQGPWYKVVLDDGRVGWVHSQYIIRELK